MKTMTEIFLYVLDGAKTDEQIQEKLPAIYKRLLQEGLITDAFTYERFVGTFLKAIEKRDFSSGRGQA